VEVTVPDSVPDPVMEVVCVRVRVPVCRAEADRVAVPVAGRLKVPVMDGVVAPDPVSVPVEERLADPLRVAVRVPEVEAVVVRKAVTVGLWVDVSENVNEEVEVCVCDPEAVMVAV